MITKEVTVGEARLALENALDAHSKNSQVDAEMLQLAVYGINNEIQIRDYALGLSLTTDPTIVCSFIKYAIVQDAEYDRCALYTILSSIYFSMGNYVLSMWALKNAIELNPDYSLARLLNRVYTEKWTDGEFNQMKTDLHPKVIKLLETMENNIIGS